MRVETLANGSGSMLGAQNVAAGSSVTGFAIERDASNNFVANVPARWTLSNKTGDIVAGDLVAAADGKSAVFTGHSIGSAGIYFSANGLTGSSATLTVITGPAATMSIETAANGSGSVVNAQNVSSGNSVTGFAIRRDGAGNFIANVAASWSLTNAVGGILNSDLVASVDNKSAVFTGHVTGTAKMSALAGSLTGTSNTLTVIAGTPALLTVETSANGAGVVLAAQNVISGSTATGFAIQRDGSGNFIANVAATWSLTQVQGGVVNSDLVPAADGKSAIFTGHVVGSAAVNALAGSLNGKSGALTVVPGTASMRVETLANGSGSILGAQNVTAGLNVTAFAIERDALNNFVANVPARWTLSNKTGGVVAGDLVVAADGKSAVFTGHLTGSAGIYFSANGLSGSSGTLLVITGPAATISLETAVNGSGSVVNAQNVSSGNSFTAFAIQRDGSGNFIANVAASWSLTNSTDGILNSDLVASVDNKSAVFTGHLTGTAKISALAGSLTGTSNTLTVIAGTPSVLKVETAANGAGGFLAAQNVISPGPPHTGFAIQRDALPATSSRTSQLLGP